MRPAKGSEQTSGMPPSMIYSWSKCNRWVESKIISIVLWPLKEKRIHRTKIWIICSEKPYNPMKVKMDFGLINHRSSNLHSIVFLGVSNIIHIDSNHPKSFKYKVFNDFIRWSSRNFFEHSIYSIDFKGTWSDNIFTLYLTNNYRYLAPQLRKALLFPLRIFLDSRSFWGNRNPAQCHQHSLSLEGPCAKLDWNSWDRGCDWLKTWSISPDKCCFIKVTRFNPRTLKISRLGALSKLPWKAPRWTLPILWITIESIPIFWLKHKTKYPICSSTPTFLILW